MKIIEILTHSDEFHTSTEKYVRMTPQAIELRDELNEKIKSGAIAFEDVPCLCGNEEFGLIAEYDKFGIQQNTVICTKCGLIQSNPRMTGEALDWFYSSDFYGKLYGRIEGRATKEFILAEAKHRPKTRHEFIKKYTDYNKVKSVLEIGCAGGWSLLPFFSDGKRVVGYDYGPALIEAGKKLGMDLRVGTIENDPTNTETYDLILINHVYEHFPRPIETMRKILRHLVPNGHIYIEVPEIKELDINSLVNAHSYSYTKKTFLHYLGKAELEPIAYQNDYKKFGSQAGLFQRAPKGYKIPPIAGEYERMKKIIERDDRRLSRRQMLKKVAGQIGLLKFAAFVTHLARKTEKHLGRNRL